MPNLVTDNSVCQCSFGSTPGKVTASPTSTIVEDNMKVLTSTMIVPNTNVAPFGMCSSLANPAVASATSANMGALTPQACTPVIAAPWSPASQTVAIANDGAVTLSSKCACAHGGSISFVQAPSILITAE